VPNSYEPQPAIDEECPKPRPGLSREAKKRWLEIAEGLHATGVLTTIDGGILAQYCEAYAGWKKACRMVAKEGAVAIRINSKGDQTPCRNPWALERDACSDRMLKYGVELGMTPSSRARIVVLPTTKKVEGKKAYKFGGGNVAGKIGGGTA